jgi:hypothetical protein
MTLPAHRYRDRAEERKQEPKHQNWAFDVDGVLDAFPRQMGTLIAALTASARHVYLITGIDAETVTKADIEAKQNFITSLGLAPEAYYELIVIPQPHAENKLKAIEANDVGVLIDNSKENVKTAVQGGCLALLLWNSKEA